MTRRDLERKIQNLANRLSQLSLEQNNIAIELSEATDELARTSDTHERRDNYQQRETLPEYNKGDRIYVENSRNRNEKKATVARGEGEKVYFRFDSGRYTWRLKHNIRPLREEEDNL